MTDGRDTDSFYGPGDAIDATFCETARELWDALDITMEQWTKDGETRCSWLFRGMRDANLPLEPPAWRKHGAEHDVVSEAKELVRRERPKERSPLGPWPLQCAAESRLLHDFIETASERGLPLPPDTPMRRGSSHPSPNHEVVALAQHHGVPTCLLDFTSDPLVAMFWASERSRNENAASLAVWALRRPESGSEDVKLYEHSRARNRNLFAQDGVAVHMAMAHDEVNAGREFPALETCGCVPRGSLKKFTLPRAEVPKLHRLLKLRGVTHAKLMPGYDGVARTVLASYR